MCIYLIWHCFVSVKYKFPFKEIVVFSTKKEKVNMNKNKTFLKYFNFSISIQTISSKEKKESKKKVRVISIFPWWSLYNWKALLSSTWQKKWRCRYKVSELHIFSRPLKHQYMFKMSVPSIQGSHVRIVDGAAQVRLMAVHHLDLYIKNTISQKFLCMKINHIPNFWLINNYCLT